MSIYSDLFENEWALGVDRTPDVVQVMDGQLTWYCTPEDFDAACEWAKGARSVAPLSDGYTEFCERCPGHVAGEESALPLMARFAHAKYDLSTGQGREAALREVFQEDEDNLAFACMMLDMEADANAAG